MSRAYALIHFKDNTVLFGCYDGTVDYLNPDMISYTDLNTKYNMDIIGWCDEICKNDISGEKITDTEPCEIYIDYGYGFVWKECTASRSKMIITSELLYDNIIRNNMDREEIPIWVYDSFVELGWNTSYIKDRVIIDN